MLASPRLVPIDRHQLLLRTVDVEKLIDEDHGARSIWKLVGRLDLSLYHAQIASVEGHAGREHTDPQLLISLWLYGYSRGISSARAREGSCAARPDSGNCCREDWLSAGAIQVFLFRSLDRHIPDLPNAHPAVDYGMGHLAKL